MNLQATERRKTQLYLTPADQGKRLSLAEFESADSQEGYRYELIHGRLEVSPIPNLPHDRLLDWLRDALKAYAVQHPDIINQVSGPARVFLPEGGEEVTAPEPDLACYQNFPEELPEEEVNWQDVSPVVVVEFISRDTADKDLTRNVSLYLRVPTIREYWIVGTRK
jgi:Uma2 family endonuclease